MPPFLYWPDRPWRVVFVKSAFDNGVREEHIKYLMSLPISEIFLYGGKPSAHDIRYSGGKKNRPCDHGSRIPLRWAPIGSGPTAEISDNPERCAVCSRHIPVKQVLVRLFTIWVGTCGARTCGLV